MQYNFCLPAQLSPTYFNLHQWLLEQNWSHASIDSDAHFNEHNFQFNVHVAETLEYKHRLMTLIHQLKLDVMPLSYHINDQNCFDVLNHIALHKQLHDLIWILKPALLNNGQHIKIFHQLDGLLKHYHGVSRIGGEHVLQQYLTLPHLLNGYKYSIRMFVVLTNYAGNYLYPDGYLNVAQHRYQPTCFTDLKPHLTNEHLSENLSNVIQVPTKPIPGFIHIYQQIKIMLSAISSGLLQLYPDAFCVDDTRTLAIFGFDFMVDAELRVWLLEANHGPCFPCDIDHPLQKHLYADFWKAFIASFVLPIASHCPVDKIQYQAFELL